MMNLDENYKKMRKNLEKKVREFQKDSLPVKVCDQCFCQKCNCENKILITMDRKMTSIIKSLNKKGYITVFCCESHYQYTNSIYIQFVKNYFKNIELPEGFKYNKRMNAIEHIILKANKKSREEFNMEKECYVNKLKEWAKALKPIENDL